MTTRGKRLRGHGPSACSCFLPCAGGCGPERPGLVDSPGEQLLGAFGERKLCAGSGPSPWRGSAGQPRGFRFCWTRMSLLHGHTPQCSSAASLDVMGSWPLLVSWGAGQWLRECLS